MASLENQKGWWRIVLRYDGQKHQRALETQDKRKALQLKARVEENLVLLKQGRLAYEPGGDLITLLLSDGKLNATPKVDRPLRLGELFDRYKQDRPPSKEGVTAYTEDIHLAHLVRLLGKRTLPADLTHEKLQGYVTARRQEPGRRGGKVSQVTVKKELGTLSSLWNKWALPNRLVPGPLPTSNLDYGKWKEKPPFQTWGQVERRIAAGGPEELWDSVFLSVGQVEELLAHVRGGVSLVRGRKRSFPFVYPMFVFCAHTGARRSEMLRSRREDFDFDAGDTGVVTVREKKKDKNKEETHRQVPMTPLLKQTMGAWFQVHPGGPLTFCKEPGVPFTPQMAHHHLRWALEGGKWKVLRGWHVFRHSFVSNLASEGVDQRIIMALVGHLNPETTRRYQHLFPSTNQEAMRKVFGGD
jgi:integrase